MAARTILHSAKVTDVGVVLECGFEADAKTRWAETHEFWIPLYEKHGDGAMVYTARRGRRGGYKTLCTSCSQALIEEGTLAERIRA